MKVIRNLQALRSEHQKVSFSNFTELENKLARFPKNFSVISDFDFTMTKYKINGHSISTIHLLRSLLPKEIILECDKLFKFYHPIELDFNLESKVRAKMMEEWWTKEYGMIAKTEIYKHQLLSIVENSQIFLRFGVREMFEYCGRSNVPVHVLSAGIGNFIEIIMQGLGIKCDIRSNFFNFDENDKIRSFNVPLIHSANKSKSVEDLQYDAVVVIGDMPSDIASVPKSARHTILIGFLNDLSLYKEEDFLNKFDIIIEGDGDFSIVNHTLRLLHSK